ncbi:MAG: hypothetical protein E7626_01230 [Ruminococcaceae bacterium]|nr:hypothetical protein [Oscillospiraceae bacterium]
MKIKRDERLAGAGRFVKVELKGARGGFDKETWYGIINLYIDRYERTFSLSDGDTMLTVPLHKVTDLINQIEGT